MPTSNHLGIAFERMAKSFILVHGLMRNVFSSKTCYHTDMSIAVCIACLSCSQAPGVRVINQLCTLKEASLTKLIQKSALVHFPDMLFCRSMADTASQLDALNESLLNLVGQADAERLRKNPDKSILDSLQRDMNLVDKQIGRFRSSAGEFSLLLLILAPLLAGTPRS